MLCQKLSLMGRQTIKCAVRSSAYRAVTTLWCCSVTDWFQVLKARAQGSNPTSPLIDFEVCATFTVSGKWYGTRTKTAKCWASPLGPKLNGCVSQTMATIITLNVRLKLYRGWRKWIYSSFPIYDFPYARVHMWSFLGPHLCVMFTCRLERERVFGFFMWANLFSW